MSKLAGILDEKELWARYATSAPRYTSYPSAADWKETVDATRYGALLEEAAADPSELSVYLHLPFCQARCLFCGCNVVITRDPHRADVYVEQLGKEMARVAKSGLGKRPVHQLHWGGGTPTFLSPELMARLQDQFLQHFTLTEDAEVAIEVDPRVTTKEQLQTLARYGFNRVSMGIQDLDPKVQEAVHRVQPLEMARRVLDDSRELGFESANVDLIYGLPFQTREGFTKTLDEVLGLEPDRIALFHYAFIPWMKKHHNAIKEEDLPTVEEKLGIFVDSVERLVGEDYEFIGLDHFARPGDELALARKDRSLQRNFMGYTTRGGHDLLGLGVSSIGQLRDVFVQNEKSVPEYSERVDQEGFAPLRGHTLSAEDLLRQDLISRIMCHGVVVKSEIEEAHGIDFDRHFAEDLAELAPLADDDLVAVDLETLRVTERGQLLLRNIALCFDPYSRERRRNADGGPAFSRTL